MHKHYNGLKTLMLFGLMWTLLLALGAGLSVGLNDSLWIFVFAGAGLIQTAYVYWNSAALSLRSMRAFPVTEAQAPVLYKIVRELSTKANQPMPKIYVAPTENPNAFATGRNPNHAAVCCTQGILNILNERELRGVLGHELMHVYNRDILTSSVASAMGGIITALAQMFMFSSRRRDESPLGGIGVIFASMLAPFAIGLIRFAISRTREFDADEDGARITGDPLALASALSKLDQGTKARPLVRTPKTDQVAAVMIANPFGNLANLFSTHPPMNQRIARLEDMAEEYGTQSQ